LKSLLRVHIDVWFVTDHNVGFYLLTHKVSEGTEKTLKYYLR